MYIAWSFLLIKKGGKYLKYRNKAVVVDAIQFTRESFVEVLYFVEGNAIEFIIERSPDGAARCNIMTPNGTIGIQEYDYIIRNSQGDFHCCKANVFDETYELEIEPEQE